MPRCPFTSGSWQMIAFLSAVSRTSNSNPSQPSSMACSKEPSVFSGMESVGSGAAVSEQKGSRTHIASQSRSKSRMGRPVSGDSLAFLTASWNFLVEQIGSVLLGFHRLAKDRVPTVVTFLHRLGRFLNIVERLRHDWGRVSNYSLGTRDPPSAPRHSTDTSRRRLGKNLPSRESYRKILAAPPCTARHYRNLSGNTLKR